MANPAMPVSPSSSRTGELPAEMTRFVGRRRELAELRELLERSRLVTLTGVGGVGKTRLALHTAAQVRNDFPDGVRFVALSGVQVPQAVPRTVADALDVPDRTAGDVVDLLADHLASRRLLLILDTCEHQVDACALMAEVLLRAAPGLRILATSRQTLEVMGEHAYRLTPLAAPDPAGGADHALGAESIELFADRAAAVLPGFALDADNRRHAARLCHRLDGIPLAIELAAVRLRALPLEQLVERLDDRFRLLGTARSAERRHQTLRAAVDWSHELCTERERLLWARLSVFPGDFALTDAERVCAGGVLPAEDLFEPLASLVEKSIVVCDFGAGRYRMLDTLREYGAEQLDLLGQRDELRRRHRDAYLALVDGAVQRWRGHGQEGLFADLRREHHNLRTALEHSLSTDGEGPAGLRMVNALDFYWVETGQLGEGREWVRRALGQVTEPGLERAWGLLLAAQFEILLGDDPGAVELLAEGLRIAEDHGDLRLTGHLLEVRGRRTHATGDHASGQADLQRAVEIFDAEGYRDPYELQALPQYALSLALGGDVERAVELCTRCVELCEAAGESWCRSLALWTRALARWFGGDPGDALADLALCLRLKVPLGDLLGITMALDLCAACTAARGEMEHAATLAAAGDALWRSMRGATMGPIYESFRQGTIDSVREALGGDAFERAWRTGAALSVPEALAVTRGEGVPSPAAPEPERFPLTRREREIAGLVAEGLSNREIAERLVIAKRTVDSHLEHILAKLGFSSRTQIATWITSVQRPRQAPS